jgi:lipoate-protein ligase A
MIIDYPLADRELINTAFGITDEASNRSVVLSTAFVPEGRYVSLGASNKPEQNVNEVNCNNDGVLVFRRQSGGEAVYISPNCVVYSSVAVGANLPKSAEFFHNNLQFVMDTLSSFGVKGIARKGISDLTINDKKILGCAIYRKPRMLLFQSVINVCESPLTIESYLLHPQREPDYRKNRKHSEFITSLHLEGYSISPQQLAEALAIGITL